MFEPRVALASLSGKSNAAWAHAAAPYVGMAVLGGIALDDPTRAAARALAERDRREFLPPDPIAFVDQQFQILADSPIRPAINVRAVSPDSVGPIARVCDRHDAILELNAHCRQQEMCRAGAGESLLADSARLCDCIRAATGPGPAVSVKVRAETGVDLAALARDIETAGADAIHIDAMDSEPVVADVTSATDLFVIGNNGVRDRETTEEYLEYGADAVSVGRASDDPAVLARVQQATTAWFEGRNSAQAEARAAKPTAVEETERGRVTGIESAGGDTA